MTDCISGEEHSKTVEWEAKGVTPILYEVPKRTQDYSILHKTLKHWAQTYRDGILGKERIVVDYAIARPSASTQQDDFVSRMLWALSDTTGLPAKQFADFDPVPPLDWLEALSENRYRHSHLIHFSVPPHKQVDDKLSFSLVRRPTPYTLAPWMQMVSGTLMDSQWDQVMFHLARWLVRHLDSPELILWLANQGGQLHQRLVWLIEQELDKFSKLERNGQTDELERIRSNAPNAIPRPLLRPLWRLLLTGRVKFACSEPDLYQWKNRLIRDGLTATLRFELRELLAPKVTLKKPFNWPKVTQEAGIVESLQKFVDWELVLAADNVNSFFNDLGGLEQWQNTLSALLDDLQQLLRDALDLLCGLVSRICG